MIALLLRLIQPPWARAVALVIALIALSALLFFSATALGFRWDPFDLHAKRLARAEATAERAASDAAARTLEVEGERRQTVRVQSHADILIAADRAIARVAAQTRDDHDLLTPLARDRANRLRAHDGELCRLAPDLAGCPAAPGPAGGGDPSLRPADPG